MVEIKWLHNDFRGSKYDKVVRARNALTRDKDTLVVLVLKCKLTNLEQPSKMHNHWPASPYCFIFK